MDLPDVGRYRRRFIVEFGPEDAGLVDRMGVVHRTKRGAIIAGLRLLESGEVDVLRARVADLERAVLAVHDESTSRSSNATVARAELAEVKRKLKEERAAHAEKRAALRATKQRLTEARRAIGTVETERRRLVGLVPHWAHCASCDKLVPDSEWAEHPAEGGVYLYHKPDGYRPKSTVLGRPSTILYWRPTAGLTETQRGR